MTDAVNFLLNRDARVEGDAIILPGFGSHALALAALLAARDHLAVSDPLPDDPIKAAEVTVARLGAAGDALANLKREAVMRMRELRVDAAASTPHPWAGRKVRHVQPGNSWRRGSTTRGIVTLMSGSYCRYRSYHPQAGEWFVMSASGATAYKLHEKWELDE